MTSSLFLPEKQQQIAPILVVNGSVSVSEQKISVEKLDIEQIEKLHALKEKGILSEEEYLEQKNRLLNRAQIEIKEESNKVQPGSKPIVNDSTAEPLVKIAPSKKFTAKQEKTIIVLLVSTLVLSVTGYFLYKYFIKRPYYKAVEYISEGNYQEAGRYADDCYASLTNSELELSPEEKKNLDLISDMITSLSKFDEFRQKHSNSPHPVLSQNPTIFNTEKNNIYAKQNLFAEIPIKRIIEKTAAGFDAKKVMRPFIDYSDSLHIGLVEYVINDSFLLAIQADRVSPSSEDYNWVKKECTSIIEQAILDREKNANKLKNIQEKLTTYLHAIADNIDRQQSRYIYEETADEPSFAANFLGTWIGKFGEKELKIVFESVKGDSLMGYNIAGPNKRSIRGLVTAEEEDYFMFVLSETGNDEQGGRYRLKMLNDNNYRATGEWKSNNGKLSKQVTINRLRE